MVILIFYRRQHLGNIIEIGNITPSRRHFRSAKDPTRFRRTRHVQETLPQSGIDHRLQAGVLLLPDTRQESSHVIIQAECYPHTSEHIALDVLMSKILERPRGRVLRAKGAGCHGAIQYTLRTKNDADCQLAAGP